MNTHSGERLDCGGDCLKCMADAGDPYCVEAMNGIRARSLPQLRVRTGYSFRHAYGHLDEVFARLKEVGATSAGIVDWGTWGHVRFEKEAKKAGIAAMYGMEIPIITFDADGEPNKLKPVAWVLATDTRGLYRGTTQAWATRGLAVGEFAALAGVVRFPGGAIRELHPIQYDYIDVNPSSISAALASMQVARETGKPVVITCYNDMPTPEHADFAYAWEVRDAVGHRFIDNGDALWTILKRVMTLEEFDQAVINTHKLAAILSGKELPKAPLIHVEGDLVALAREGQASRLARGHIDEWTPVYEDRLQEEIRQIQLKEFDSYFLVVADLVRYAKKHMLVGPARGSAAGSLLCYLVGITEVDPIPHELLFQRFIDISRSDFPDIDIDFADDKRFMVFDYLKEKYGKANVSKMGNINTLKANSTMAQVSKKFGLGFGDGQQVKNSVIEYSSGDDRYGYGLEDTFKTTESGREFAERFPDAARCMGDLELHPSHSGVHAAALLVCNEPISDFCTVTEDGIAQVDKPDSEYLNLLKIDALGLRTLGIIDDAKVVTAEQLYGMKLDDPAVLKILGDDKMSGIFQFEGDAVRGVTRSVTVDRFSKIDNLTALARPGPLSSGMARKYIARANGTEKVTYSVPQLERHLRDTYGVFLYQEQIMSVVRDLGAFDWAKTSEVRKLMAKSKGAEALGKLGVDFVAGATAQGIPEDDAKAIWQDMAAFGAYGFNKSHSVAYAIVTYWTCWLKCYHPIEFAAACLRDAKDDDQVIAILREMAKEGITYTPIDPEFSEMNWKAVDGRLIGGIMNAKGYGPVKALKYIEARRARHDGEKEEKSFAKMVASLAKSEVQYADLQEAHTKWGHFYRDPALAGVTSGNPILGMKKVKDRDDGLVIAKLVKKAMGDENEAARVKKRGGKVMKGETRFIDLYMVDDSADSPMRFRIRPDKFIDFGKPIAESAPVNSWYLIRAWKIQGIDMFIIKNIKRLDPPPPEPEKEEE